MPLVVVILPKTEKSQQVFNEHELLGLAIRVEVQKNSRLIGQCHRCQKLGQDTLHLVQEHEHQKNTERQKKKFGNLVKSKKSKPTLDTNRTVINLSSRNLSPCSPKEETSQ
ncbi:unnamed protein product [Acanthoscelides obtectus]|uniref:Uncharacterized protein n=1 Tax=Acanthoscelides obtectus TaxID=200917 RepID=A0A9P0K927_ACAOB|nr:unnamed protein product [Acanthoscelides obtectus]CAK1656005.1 hypothetical protein AOBTE_LOCUS19505 [Acanthoscelides obtectus]